MHFHVADEATKMERVRWQAIDGAEQRKTSEGWPSFKGVRWDTFSNPVTVTVQGWPSGIQFVKPSNIGNAKLRQVWEARNDIKFAGKIILLITLWTVVVCCYCENMLTFASNFTCSDEFQTKFDHRCNMGTLIC